MTQLRLFCPSSQIATPFDELTRIHIWDLLAFDLCLVWLQDEILRCSVNHLGEAWPSRPSVTAGWSLTVWRGNSRYNKSKPECVQLSLDSKGNRRTSETLKCKFSIAMRLLALSDHRAFYSLPEKKNEEIKHKVNLPDVWAMALGLKRLCAGTSHLHQGVPGSQWDNLPELSDTL